MSKVLFFLTVIFLMSSVSFANLIDENVIQRISPIGNVKMADSSTEETSQKTASTASSGEAIYNQYCMACHAAGVAGAPRPGVKNDWSARKGKGIKQILSNVINGYKLMPARGNCFDCSDDELRAAVEYMLPG